MALIYDVGDVAGLELAVRDPGPNTVAVVEVRDPTGAVTTHAGVPDAIRGRWRAAVRVDRAGRWTATWTVTGGGAGVEVHTIGVRPPGVAPRPTGSARQDVPAPPPGSSEVWDVGDIAPITLTVDHAGPGTHVRVVATRPDGSTLPAIDATPDDDRRVWRAPLPLDRAGLWAATWTVTGPGAGVEHWRGTVRPGPDRRPSPAPPGADLADYARRDYLDAQLTAIDRRIDALDAGGGVSLSATHRQDVPSQVWVVDHGLGREPSAWSLHDVDGLERSQYLVTHLTLNRLTVRMDTACAGTFRCI